MKASIEPNWKAGTWRGAEQARRQLDRQLTFRQKLEWNASALALSQRLRRCSSETGDRLRQCLS